MHKQPPRYKTEVTDAEKVQQLGATLWVTRRLLTCVYKLQHNGFRYPPGLPNIMNNLARVVVSGTGVVGNPRERSAKTYTGDDYPIVDIIVNYKVYGDPLVPLHVIHSLAFSLVSYFCTHVDSIHDRDLSYWNDSRKDLWDNILPTLTSLVLLLESLGDNELNAYDIMDKLAQFCWLYGKITSNPKQIIDPFVANLWFNDQLVCSIEGTPYVVGVNSKRKMPVKDVADMADLIYGNILGQDDDHGV